MGCYKVSLGDTNPGAGASLVSDLIRVVDGTLCDGSSAPCNCWRNLGFVTIQLQEDTFY